jgi:2-iminoacetate synthase
MTLEEYLSDYATQETKEVGNAIIKKYLEDITNEKVKVITKERLDMIRNGGERDFRF